MKKYLVLFLVAIFMFSTGYYLEENYKTTRTKSSVENLYASTCLERKDCVDDDGEVLFTICWKAQCDNGSIQYGKCELMGVDNDAEGHCEENYWDIYDEGDGDDEESDYNEFDEDFDNTIDQLQDLNSE